MIHVFALNLANETRLTDLTRARGEVAELPDLAGWLGVEAINTDRIELFPVEDLAGMGLDHYLLTAHVVDPTALEPVAARLRALEGSVLIVPEEAMTGAPDPGPEASAIAVLPRVEPDHGARLDPAPIPARKAPMAEAPKPAAIPALPWIAGAALILAAALIWGLT